MKNILNVLRFEYKGFVGAKSFRIVTLIFIIGILIATSLPQIIGSIQTSDGGAQESKENAALILSGDALTNEIYKQAFAPDALAGVTPANWIDLSGDPPDDTALAEALSNGDYIFAVRYSGGTEFDFYLPGNRMATYNYIGAVSDYITSVVRDVKIQTLPADTREAVTQITTLTAEPKIIDIGGNAENNFLIGYVLIMFLLYTIIGYSNYVSSSVVTEKTSKAMELLITAVKPIHLMVGKVLGVGLAALTQVGAIVAAFVVGILINFSYWQETDNLLFQLTQQGNVGASIAVILIVYFLLGFFLYAFLSAAFASTVTRPEEAATVTIVPLLFVLVALMIGFMTLFGALSKGLAEALSFIPFFTPIAMLARYTLGDASVAQLIIGAVILVAAIIAVAVFAAKVFRMGVMLYGVKATPKQIIKALKNS